MKNRTNLLLIVLGCILFSSCNTKAPKPCFELNCESLRQIDQILAGEDVLVSNCTDNGISFSWDFGDGTSSTLNSPHHVWETPGDYTITLNVENEDSEKSITEDITVSPSVYGIWEGSFVIGEEPYAFSLDLEQAAYKIKGKFTRDIQGGYFRPTGVLSSNSVLAGDSVILFCALIYSFGDQTFSSIYQLKGTINSSMDTMSGDHLIIGTREYGSWEATKK
ncbi:MAG: PKD domain-containing protein [Bacteroidales bacterium]|nr:PKD domain-containing protein [Bacteroidales bacterium]